MIKFLAAFYVAACLTWAGVWVIRRTDRHFWRGAAVGLGLGGGYVLFICAVSFLIWGWR